MALADLGSGFPAAGETAVLSLFAACVAFGQAAVLAVLGVHVLQGTALPAAAAAAAAAVDGMHAGHLVVLAELGKPQAAALLGIPVAENAPDRTAVIASDACQRRELDKTGGVVGPGHAVLGIQAEVLGCAVLSLIVVVFADVKEAEKLASDYFVVHTVDNLPVVVPVAVVVAVHGKETAAAVVVVAVAVTGDLKKPADFPKKK